MNQKLKTGRSGEDIASQYLMSLGYEILERNWTGGRAELDIIYKDEDVLVFVEVKTRRGSEFGDPSSFQLKDQEGAMVDTAQTYMREVSHEWAFRFDLIGILMREDQSYELKHFKDIITSEL